MPSARNLWAWFAALHIAGATAVVAQPQVRSRLHGYVGGPYKVRLADVTSDKKIDLVIGYRNVGVVAVQQGNGRGQFGKAIVNDFSDQFRKVQADDNAWSEPHIHNLDLGDVDGDGQLDLIIYDRCSPEEMPQTNTFFIGALPPGDDWKKNNKSGSPAIIDSDASHPLMELVSTNNISIVDAFGIEAPQGKTILIDADIGPLLTVAPRAAFEDLVMSFEIMTKNANGEFEPATTWPLRRSFPVFQLNMLRYLGGGSGGEGESFTVQPGDPVPLKTASATGRLVITAPNKETYTIAPNSQDLFVHTMTEQLGVYEVRVEGEEEIQQRFAVNLFDPQESNIIPRERFELPYEPVERSAGVSEKRKDVWKWVLLLGLAVLVFEWYVYNKRVYF